MRGNHRWASKRKPITPEAKLMFALETASGVLVIFIICALGVLGAIALEGM